MQNGVNYEIHEGRISGQEDTTKKVRSFLGATGMNGLVCALCGMW